MAKFKKNFYNVIRPSKIGKDLVFGRYRQTRGKWL